MYEEYAQPLRISLRPSFRLAVILPVAHLLACVAVFWTTMPTGLCIFLFVLLVFNLYWTFGRFVRRRGPAAVTAMVWGPQLSWQLGSADGRWRSATLRPDSRLLPGMVLLSLQTGDKRQRVLLFGDMLDGECWRRLRVRLRLASRHFCAKGAGFS